MNTLKLTTGTLESSANMAGWVITSDRAIVEGAEDMPLQQGDCIDASGDVYRNGEHLGNVE